jgi:hypothetical protein
MSKINGPLLGGDRTGVAKGARHPSEIELSRAAGIELLAHDRGAYLIKRVRRWPSTST